MRRNSTGWRAVRRTVAFALAVALSGCAGHQAAMLSGGDQADLARITAYLNTIPRFEAHFLQSGSFGTGAGLVWLDRPGHLRIDYAGPGARVMVIAGGRVTILDRSNNAVTTQPLSRTPLGILLSPTIQLDGPVRVDSLVRTTDAAGLPHLDVRLSKTGQSGQGSLALDLTDRPLQLRAVSVTDPYGRVLQMALAGMETSPVITAGLFSPPG